MKRVVVTGLGQVSALGNNIPDFWKNLTDGKSGACPITHFDCSKFKTRFACEVKDFDPTTLMTVKEARQSDPFVHFATFAATEAFADAGIDFDKEDRTRMGVILGSGMGGVSDIEEGISEYATGDGTPRFNPFFIPRMLCDIAAGHISLRFGLKGPNYATVSACASSSHAIADAFNLIRLGKADIMLAGGSEAAIHFTGVGGFNAMHALSTRNDDYLTASRPFSGSRDGFVLGEGGACLVLEEYEHAKQRGAKIYAELAGEGMTADAHHITAPDPEGDGARRVMLEAIKDAGADPTDIDYINAHGTATRLGDLAEIKAITSLFGEHAYKLNISSTKSMTGHLLGAAGALEAIATILAVYNDEVPPTINHTEGDDDPDIDPRLNLTFNKSQKRTVNYALSNTFGFGGHNASLLFKKI